jgi:hypothetical protein
VSMTSTSPPLARRSYRQFQQSKDVVEPRFLHILEAVAYSGISRSTLYELAPSHKGLFRKAGKRVLVDLKVLDKLLDGLPAAKIKAPPRKGRAA